MVSLMKLFIKCPNYLNFQIKNDIAITMFPYKIIHNILATKVSLFRAKICDKNICPQCLTGTYTLLRSHVLKLIHNSSRENKENHYRGRGLDM